MTEPLRSHRAAPAKKKGRALVAVLAVLAVAAAAFLTVRLLGGGSDTPQASATPPPVGSGATQGGAAGGSQDGRGDASRASRGEPLAASVPQRVRIPSLDVSSTLEGLGQGKGGQMETPRDPDKAGWYTPGVAPGARGPAVIAGHVTWNGAKAVFFKLSTLKVGDRIEVDRKDGRTAEFRVDRIAQYPKDRFPTVEVYQNLDHAGLRLITCGGKFSEGDRRYADNVVVFASLAGSR